MSKLARYAVLLSLLICFVVATPASAQSPGCQKLLKHGIYEGPIGIAMTVQGIEGGVLLQEFIFNETGQLSLTIECSVTAGTSHWNVHRTVMMYPGATVVVCDYTVDLSQATGSVVVGANGQPRIDIRWGQGVINPNDCTSSGPADTAATWRFSLNGPPQDRTIRGDFRIDFDDPDAQDADELAQAFRDQGYQVTLNKGWTLTRLPQPEVQSLNADLRQFFLAGIPVTNRYRAAIDWDGALLPGTARFIVGSEAPRAMTVAGNTATLDLPLEQVQGTGDLPISVEAELDGRFHRLNDLGPLTLVPVPAWTRPFNLQAQAQGAEVRYNGIFSVPNKPLDAHIVLPADLPFIGGAWGLLPTQFRLALAASSLGTREPGSLSAQGGFGLGQRTHTLSASGNIFGTLTHDTLNFESEELTLSTPRIAFEQRIGLFALIPGIDQLFNRPVVGGLLEAFVASTSVTADIHGSMTGRGRLGVSGDELALTTGNFDALLGVGLTAGPNNGFIAAMLSGGGDGSLKMQIVPKVQVLACRIQLFFAARFQFLGFLGLPAAETKRTVTLNSCGAAAAQGLQDVPSPRAAEADITYIPPDELSEQSLSAGQVTNGLTETVLAENANPQARPALVAGPGSRLALVWTSAGSGAEAVSVRLFDGAIWSNVLIVSQAGRPAVMPSAAFTANGRLLVTWAEAPGAPDPAGLTVAFVRSLDIAWAEVDPTTNQVVSRGLVASDSIMDFAPRLSQAADGTVWLAWQSSPGTDLAGAAASPNQWKAAAWIGSGWTATETAGQNGVGILFWEMAAVDANRVWVVADVDMDGDLGTASDREVYVYKRTAAGWAAPYRLTHDAVIDSAPLLALTPDGQPVMVWRHGDDAIGLTGDPASTQPQTWFDSSAGVGNMLGGGRLLAGAGGTLTLLWADATTRGQDVWLSRFNPAAKVWSPPAPLFHSAEVRQAPSALLMPVGDILLGLAAMPVASETATFDDGSTAQVPAVGNAARLLVTRIPADYLPTSENETLFLFLPLVARR